MTMAAQPTWEEVEGRLATTKATTAIALAPGAGVLVLVDPSTKSLGLIAPAGSTPATALVRLARGVRIQPHGPDQTAVWIDEATLLKPGLDFLLLVSRRVIGNGEPIGEAVEAQLEAWRELVAGIVETQTAASIGVLGELAFLRAALELGHDVSCWVGIAGGAIDFRFGALECEVKTTTGAHHEHIIHGADQLQPSVGGSLVLVSILVAAAESGHGTSINQLIGDLAAHGVKRPQLEAELLSVRQVAVTDPIALRGFVLRNAPAGFTIDEGFPALTSKAIASLFGSQAARIRDVEYRLRLDGLPASTDAEVATLLANVRL
jgi:hypothetical protein